MLTTLSSPLARSKFLMVSDDKRKNADEAMRLEGESFTKLGAGGFIVRSLVARIILQMHFALAPLHCSPKGIAGFLVPGRAAAQSNIIA